MKEKKSSVFYIFPFSVNWGINSWDMNGMKSDVTDLSPGLPTDVSKRLLF